jgi:adenylate cyclase
MSEGRVERRLAAILAADVVGYSRLMGEDEAGTLSRLAALRRALIDPKIADHKGRIVKTTGDGLLIEFPSVVGAVACAVAVQRDMAEHNISVLQDQRIEFRVGINMGDVIIEGDDIHGDGVNVAARLEALATPGGICVSSIVHEQVRGRLEIGFEDLGEQSLKNIVRPVRVYRVRAEAGTVTSATVALPLPDKPSIAVLPFQNMSGDPEQEYFADGMVEEIITALSRIRWLFVIARNSSFTYKGQAIDVKRVSRELGVRYVLEGSVRKAGGRVRVTAQLIDALSGAHVWADRYDRDLSDVFAVQDEITASVAGVIEPALAEAEQQRVLRKPPERLDVWEAYQRGLWHFYKYTAEENQIALTFFRQAMALDPNFAPSHYGCALALHWEIWFFSGRPLSEVQGLPREEAHIAVGLDDRDAMAHAVLAHMLMWGSEWDAAISEARIAFALNPNSAFVISMLGVVLCYGGHNEEGLDRLHQAFRASPHEPLRWLWTVWLGAAHWNFRDYATALELFRQVIRQRPGHRFLHFMSASALALLGRLDEARATFDRAAAQFPDELPRLSNPPPYMRPEDWELRLAGLRLITGANGGQSPQFLASLRSDAPRRARHRFFSPQMAGHRVRGSNLPQHRRLAPAALFGVHATCVEMAARGRRDRARHIARQQALFPLHPRVRDRHRSQQRLGVRMQWPGEQRPLVGALDDPAEIHHRDAMADVLDHSKIVRDEQIGQGVDALQLH